MDQHSQSHGVWDWTARIHASQTELKCSYNVIIFTGSPPEDPKEWLICPQFVGKLAVHVPAGRGYGRRMRSDNDIVEGFVHLSQAIAQRSGLASLEPEQVVPYLKQSLTWRVQELDDTPVELQSLEVVVFATPLAVPPGGQFPVPGESQRYDDITRGKKGGSRNE
ncbi:hypothetical protein D9619_010204 [Psilocybe cf. subviscida]|uniref:Tyrosinase C-terminal domain-containing protein n=1 Tax=Psilocybe cf. subviscida TaxID=2480587 RepID=A0A8H5ERP5_9AGAR|nr:hypothetical protein D9619_010204 [Psilocybe cf. subviscida]